MKNLIFLTMFALIFTGVGYLGAKSITDYEAENYETYEQVRL